MGASNASAAFIVGSDLPHVQKIVLIRMALVTLDADQPPRYFAGWELLALALGYDVPPTTDQSPEAKSRRHTARTNVRRALAELKRKGLITSHGFARQGRNAEYHLHLLRTASSGASREVTTTSLDTPRAEPPTPSEGGGGDLPEGGGGDLPPGRSPRPREGGSHDLPKEEEEPVLGARSGTIPALAGNVTSARETTSTADDEEYAKARTLLISQGPTIHDRILHVMQTQNLSRRDAVIEVARSLRTKEGAA
nr:hypothetical protein [Sphaerisporangium cinnabarinum]